MTKNIFKYGGIMGNIIGMIMMPCCFPVMLSILAWFGIYTLSMGPMTLYVITGSLILMIISQIIQFRQTHSYYGLSISIISSTGIIYYLFQGGNVWLYYIGLIGVFGTSIDQIFLSRSHKTCNICK